MVCASLICKVCSLRVHKSGLGGQLHALGKSKTGKSGDESPEISGISSDISKTTEKRLGGSKRTLKSIILEAIMRRRPSNNVLMVVHR